MRIKLGDATEGDFQTHNDNLLNDHLSSDDGPDTLPKITACCRFCADEKYLVISVDDDNEYHVRCCDCGSSGPGHSTEKAAIEDWNNAGREEMPKDPAFFEVCAFVRNELLNQGYPDIDGDDPVVSALALIWNGKIPCATIGMKK